MAYHHFVPQTYLRGFATLDDEDRVYFYDRRVGAAHKRMIEDVCGENNLYRLMMDDGEPKDDLEDTFAKVAEPIFAEIVRKLLNRQALTPQERSEFSAFIALQIVRTPRTHKLYDALATHVMESESNKMWAKLLDDEERKRVFDEMTLKTGHNFSGLTKEHIQGIIDGTKFTTKWTIPKENWIKHTMEMMEEVFRAFEKMHWRVYYAPRGTAFITSDNPVNALSDLDGIGGMAGGGFLVPNSVRLFPLSKSACLAIYDQEPPGFSFVDANRRRVKQVNEITLKTCDKVLISHDQRLLDRCVKRLNGYEMLPELIERQIAEYVG